MARNKKKLSTKQLRQIKKVDNLESNTVKLVKQANARLDTLQRRYKKGTWASKRLQNKLATNVIKGWNRKSGKIKIPKNASRTQLRAINKAVVNFLNSKTSTKKGIKEVRVRTIESLKGTLSIDLDEITTEEAETLYNMFGDNDFQDVASKIGSSTLQACIEDAIENNDDENTFIKRLGWYSSIEFNDVDIRNSAISIYNKYVL